MTQFGYDGHRIVTTPTGRVTGRHPRPRAADEPAHVLAARPGARRARPPGGLRRPARPRPFRPAQDLRQSTMPLFARQVSKLIDHLRIESAVVGGTSLGATSRSSWPRASPRRCAGW